MRLYVTPTFGRAVKKLHPQQKSDLDETVRAIASDPECGEAKVGDLLGIRVYKFRLSNQLCMLAYRILDKNRGCPRFCVIGLSFNASAYAHRT